MLPNRLKFFFAGGFLEAVNPRIPGRPYEEIGSALCGPAPASILDVCSGTGYLARHVARRFPDADVAALDLSPELLAYGRRKAAADGVPSVIFVRGDAANLPFADARFDLVLAAFGLHELNEMTRVGAAAEMARVLRPGGRLVVADLDMPRAWRHVFDAYLRVSHGHDARGVLGHGLRDLLVRAGFEIAAHRGELGGILPFQIVEATLPSGAQVASHSGGGPQSGQ